MNAGAFWYLRLAVKQGAWAATHTDAGITWTRLQTNGVKLNLSYYDARPQKSAEASQRI